MVSSTTVVLDETVVGSFPEWARDAEPRLSQALIASFGSQLGEEAAAEALAFAWEHWDRVSKKDKPLAYVFVVGRNRARRASFWRRPVFLEVDSQRLPDVEPGLPGAMAGLSEKQRIVVKGGPASTP